MRYGYIKLSKENKTDAEAHSKEFREQRDRLGEIDITITDTDGSNLQELIRVVKSGDSIHISGIEKISRDMETVLSLHNQLRRKGVKLYLGQSEWESPSDMLKVMMDL